jgi:hypothetical protein
LVHLLANGSYPERTIQSGYPLNYSMYGKPNILRENDYHHKYQLREDGKWKVKFLHESSLFKGNELCDCWDGNTTMSSSVEKNVENRFFQLRDINLAVSFVKKLGVHPIHAHNLTSLDSSTVMSPASYDANAYDQQPYDWYPASIEDAVEDILRKMPKREQTKQVVLWNDGVWLGFAESKLEEVKTSLHGLLTSVGSNGQVCLVAR